MLPEVAPAPTARNIHVVLSGNAALGVAPTFEFGRRVTGFFRFNLPLEELLNFEDGDEFTLGLGGGLVWYITGDGEARGLYLAPTLEFLNTVDTYDDGGLAVSMVAAAGLGYRWSFAPGFFGMGGLFGRRTSLTDASLTDADESSPSSLVLRFTAHAGAYF